MNKIVTCVIIVAISITAFAQKQTPKTNKKSQPMQTKNEKRPAIITDLQIGSDIPLANMPVQIVGLSDLDGKEPTLHNLHIGQAFVVLFVSNVCPYVRNEFIHLREIIEFCKMNKMVIVLVNSNEGARSQGESQREMMEFVTRNNLNVPYILDQKNRLADAFGARTTPEAFLFNGEGKLVYRGAIDDNPTEPMKTMRNYLKEALSIVTAKGKFLPDTTKAVGCDIKRR